MWKTREKGSLTSELIRKELGFSSSLVFKQIMFMLNIGMGLGSILIYI